MMFLRLAAKGAAAGRQSENKLNRLLGRALNTVPVLRVFLKTSAIRIVALLPVLTLPVSYADQRTANWQGDFSPCNQKSELLKRDPMNLGVKISTSNPVLAHEFREALNFWSTVVDMHWHEDSSETCAMQLVDGTTAILKSSIVARSQFTEWDNFQGWIAFNPKAPLTNTELYLTAVHEIGHMLGLKHNPSIHSVMYYLDLEGTEVLDQTDLSTLAIRHKLRVASLSEPITVER